MTKVMGIDPGISGALAWIDTEDWSLSVRDMPKEPGRRDKNAVSPIGVALIFQEALPDYVFIEDVWSSPQMGVSSAFSFGRSLGIVEEAATYGSILTKVTPQEWKSKTKTPKDKNEARRRAQQLFPCAYKLFERVKDDGRAEASILCFYGLLSLHMAPTKPLVLKE